MAEALIETAADVRHVLDLMDEHADQTRQERGSHGPSAMEMMATTISSLSSIILAGDREKVNWKTKFISIGAEAKKIIEYFNASAFIKLLLDKHALYGVGPFRQWKEVGICVRLTSKLERLKNIIRHPEKDVGDESWTDTLHDIVGYCVLGWWLQERKI